MYATYPAMLHTAPASLQSHQATGHTVSWICASQMFGAVYTLPHTTSPCLPQRTCAVCLCAARLLCATRADFEGKVVMDVGAGSGILSLFAAMVGDGWVRVGVRVGRDDGLGVGGHAAAVGRVHCSVGGCM